MLVVLGELVLPDSDYWTVMVTHIVSPSVVYVTVDNPSSVSGNHKYASLASNMRLFAHSVAMCPVSLSLSLTPPFIRLAIPS